MALEGALQEFGGKSSGRTPTPANWQAINAAEAVQQPSRNADQTKLLNAEKTIGDPVTRPDMTETQWNAAAGFGGGNDDALAGALSEFKGTAPKEKPALQSVPKAEAQPKTMLAGPVRDVKNMVGSTLAAPGAAIAGGFEGAWTLARELAAGKSFDQAMDTAANTTKARQGVVAFEPDTNEGQLLQDMMGSKFNPVNWPGAVIKHGGEMYADMALKGADALQKVSPELADKLRTASAVIGTTVETGGNAALLLAGGRAASGGKPVVAAETPAALRGAATAIEAPKVNYDVPTYIRQRQTGAVPLAETAAGTPPATAATAPPVAPARPTAPPAGRGGPTERVSSAPPAPVDLGLKVPEAGSAAAAIEAEPVKGGLPPAAQQGRAAVLQRLGITKAWESAVKGDALEGATNAQTARFDQPAGRAAAAQFAAETDAIRQAASEVATKGGGILGGGEAAAFERGSKLAQPFDKLRQWFDQQESKMYKLADEKTGGMPVVSAEPIDALLKDRSFKNTIMAKDKGHLLTAIEDQLALFKENNPQGLTVKNAEQFRQWLNQQWSHDNSAILGQVKTAVDKAVTRAAGEDVYASSRAMHVLKKATLDDPKGVARLMDADPKNPINRAVAIEKIPQAIERLSLEQFKNVVDTLRKKMPPELKAEAAAAEAQMKAHFVQGIIDAGTPNTKTPSPFWNNRKVNDYLSANEEKMSHLFTKAEQARLADIRAGGNIIAVDASYPGAAAQAANAAKQGLLSRIISPVATSIGAGSGTLAGGFFGMPVQGGMLGSVAGKAAGERMSAAAAEKSALKGLQKRMIPLSEVGK